MCECDICVRNRKWREDGVPSEIMEYILDLEMDRDYYKSIVKGTWPDAKRILTEALDKLNGDH